MHLIIKRHPTVFSKIFSHRFFIKSLNSLPCTIYAIFVLTSYIALPLTKMRFTLAFILTTLTLGVNAGCQYSPIFACGTSSAIAKGITAEWGCDLPSDRPCQTTCESFGSRQRDENNVEYLICCKPCKLFLSISYTDILIRLY